MQTHDTYTDRAAAATLEAARSEHDFGGWIAGVLVVEHVPRPSRNIPSTVRLLGRPYGSARTASPGRAAWHQVR